MESAVAALLLLVSVLLLGIPASLLLVFILSLVSLQLLLSLLLLMSVLFPTVSALRSAFLLILPP
jgi:hypothetical protein